MCFVFFRESADFFWFCFVVLTRPRGVWFVWCWLILARCSFVFKRVSGVFISPNMGLDSVGFGIGLVFFLGLLAYV